MNGISNTYILLSFQAFLYFHFSFVIWKDDQMKTKNKRRRESSLAKSSENALMFGRISFFNEATEENQLYILHEHTREREREKETRKRKHRTQAGMNSCR